MKNTIPRFVLFILLFLVGTFKFIAQKVFDNHKTDTLKNDTVFFSEAISDIKLEQVNRRKWDNPVIADLDQDGYPDLLLTDHGYAIKLFWNDKGRFSKSYDLIMGDTHGIGIGDYDMDDKMDILVSRGGGSGSNARNTKIFHISKKRNITEGNKFATALMKFRGRTNKLFDGDNDGDLDLILMGFSSRENKKSENYLYKNNGTGDLILDSNLPKTNGDGQKILITDFNNDFISDILIYGDKQILVYKGKGNLRYTDVTDSILPYPITDVTGIAEIDYDNDGDFDLYVTRNKELKKGETFFDKENNRLYFANKRGKFQLQDIILGNFLELTNYQSAYPHQDIHIGESAYLYEYPREYHSGQNIKIVNSNALGFPDETNEKGFYLGYVGNRQWRLAGDSNPQISAVIEGVLSYPDFDHEMGLSDILLKNQNDKFIDVTKKTNIFLQQHSKGVAIGDFDNNGYSDVFVVQRGNPSKQNSQVLFLNTGKGKFKRREDHGIVSKELGALGSGADCFDYNLDGKLDIIYANDRGKWHLFKNQGVLSSDQNYIILQIGNSLENKTSALGAVVTIVSNCGQKQVFRIGSSGSPYSQGFNNTVHFGLGMCTKVNTINVMYSDGKTITKKNIKSNTVVKIN